MEVREQEQGAQRVIVVGAGFFGATVAERLAACPGTSVLVIERRSHPGGNSYSRPDPVTGIDTHLYGSHIFHTDKKPVWDYVSRFVAFNAYRHVVWAESRGRCYPLPFSLATMSQFFGRTLGPEEARSLVADEAAREGAADPGNLEEKAISLVGRTLYEHFIEG